MAQQEQVEVHPSGKEAGLGPPCFQELPFATHTSGSPRWPTVEVAGLPSQWLFPLKGSLGLRGCQWGGAEPVGSHNEAPEVPGQDGK